MVGQGAGRDRGCPDRVLGCRPGAGAPVTTKASYTVAQAARLLGLSASGVRSRIQTGTLAATREGTRLIIDAHAVDNAAADAGRSATWWRKATQASPDKASRRRGLATRALVGAATAWRENPTDPELIQALQAAVDVRNSVTVRTRANQPQPP